MARRSSPTSPPTSGASTRPGASGGASRRGGASAVRAGASAATSRSAQEPAAPRRGASAAGGAPGGGRRGGKARAQLRQVGDVYRMTRRADPSVTWWLLGAAVVPVVLGVVIGLVVGHPVYVTVLGVFAALLLATFVLGRRAERAAYTSLEGQPGAAGAALRALRRGWSVGEEPVAIDPRTRDTVFRAVGRPGVVLVSDGPAHRVGKLLEGERRRVARVLPDVPIHTFQAGSGSEQVPISKLQRRVMRLRPTLTKPEVDEVRKRLRALGGVRPPIPQGVDPLRARPDRKGARGR